LGGLGFCPRFRPQIVSCGALISFIINFYAPARLTLDGQNDICLMNPDLEDYWADLDGYDLTDAEKSQLIHTLWAMMESFVDSAFGVHPVQQAVKSRRVPDSNSPSAGIESIKQSRKQESLSATVTRKAADKRK